MDRWSLSRNETHTRAVQDDAVQELVQDVHDFWQPLNGISRVDATKLTPLAFLRDFVSKNVPVVLTNGMAGDVQWQKVLAQWQHKEYLIDRAGEEHLVHVNVTPFGFGDAVLELMQNKEEEVEDGGDDDTPRAVFVMPEEREMTLSQFYAILHDREHFDGVPYLSHQNDSLRDEFPDLFAEVPRCLDLAREAFGNEPEAVNLWIGDERAVSTMHKDHYENMYCVVKGRKHFTLLPPPAIAALYETEYPTTRYHCQNATQTPGTSSNTMTNRFHAKYPSCTSWSIEHEPDSSPTPWIPVDPLAVDAQRFPLASTLQPIECMVHAGEILYLPSLWFHRATQLEETISVNYWHDMQFDHRYVYYNFVNQFAKRNASKNRATEKVFRQEDAGA